MKPNVWDQAMTFKAPMKKRFRLIYLTHGIYAHLTDASKGNLAALCGRYASSESMWRGLGCDHEAEEASLRIPCIKCQELSLMLEGTK